MQVLPFADSREMRLVSKLVINLGSLVITYSFKFWYVNTNDFILLSCLNFIFVYKRMYPLHSLHPRMYIPVLYYDVNKFCKLINSNGFTE